MDVKKNVTEIQQKIQLLQRKAQPIHLVAATKYVGISQMIELYQSGIRAMGENRIEALLEKKAVIQLPIEWHFIGTLQSRKVKEVINEVDYLHSLDRLSLAKEIQKHRKHPLKCFVQVNISEESSKHGLKKEEVIPFIQQLEAYSQIEVVGLMTMAPHTDDEQKVRQCFKELKSLQQKIDQQLPGICCTELSMGMSNDYLVAIEEGATYIRLGSLLFQ